MSLFKLFFCCQIFLIITLVNFLFAGSFKDEIKKINENISLTDHDKDKVLAEFFRKYINPNFIPDGHCAKCAFNTYLYLRGGCPYVAEAPGTSEFKKFGDWFYNELGGRIPLVTKKTITAEPSSNMENFRKKTEIELLKITKKGDAILISIDEGTHWYNAYNDGKRIWFIDSQTGKGFNTYGSGFDPSTQIDIIIIPDNLIEHYYNNINAHSNGI